MRIMLDIKVKQGIGICTVSSICNVLNYYGIKISEFQVYLLVNGFQTTFYNGYVSLNTLVGIDVRLQRAMGKHIIFSDHAPHSLDMIIQSLQKKEPVLLQIDSSYLAYDERLRKEYNFIRTFIIYGIDLEKRVFHIYDTLHLDQNQMPEVISFEAPIDLILCHAKEMIAIGRVSDFQCPINYKQLLIDNLSIFISKNDDGTDMLYGLSAIAYHIDYLERVLQEDDKEKKDESSYYATNTIIFGTFGPMCKYLIEAIESLNLIRKEEMILELKVRSSKWIILSNKALKLTVTKRKNQDVQFIERYRIELQKMLDLITILLTELTVSKE